MYTIAERSQSLFLKTPGTYLIQAVEQVTQAGPLEGRGGVERVKADSEGVVALLQDSFQEYERLAEVALGVII